MAVAEKYDVPRSIFLGRPLPLPGEPLFLPDDTDWALEWELYQRGVCTDCGTRHSVWQGRKPTDPPFVAVLTRCPGREAMAIAEKEIPESEQGRGAYATLISTDEWEWREEFKDAAERLGLRKPKLRWL